MGTWHGTCDAVANSDNTESVLYHSSQAVYLANGSVTSALKYYADAACTTLRYTMQLAASIKVGGASTVVPGAFEIDFAPSKIQITPVLASSVASFNKIYSNRSEAACKNLTFTAGKATDVTACNTEAKQYSVFKISGGKLYGGDCSGKEACSNEADRATTLDNDSILTKVK